VAVVTGLYGVVRARLNLRIGPGRGFVGRDTGDGRGHTIIGKEARILGAILIVVGLGVILFAPDKYIIYPMGKKTAQSAVEAPSIG